MIKKSELWGGELQTQLSRSWPTSLQPPLVSSPPLVCCLQPEDLHLASDRAQLQLLQSISDLSGSILVSVAWVLWAASHCGHLQSLWHCTEPHF